MRNRSPLSAAISAPRNPSRLMRTVASNIRLELPGFIHGGNQDGIHVQGPGRFLVLRNIQGRTGDDFIALNGDEETIGERSFIHPCATVGPISDVVVDTVMVDDAAQVVRDDPARPGTKQTLPLPQSTINGFFPEATMSR